MDKTTQKKSAKYEGKLASAYELFSSKGGAEVSVDEIVKRAGVAKGTFYLYFKDKTELISKLIVKKATEYINQAGKIPFLDDADDYAVCIKKYIDLLIGFLYENPALTVLIDKNVHTCLGAVIANREAQGRELYDRLFSFFSQMGYSMKEIELRLYIYSDMVVSSCCNAILRGAPYSLEEIRPSLYAIALSALPADQHSLSEAVKID